MVATDPGRVHVAREEHEFAAQNIAHGKDLDRWGFPRATPVLVEPCQHDGLVGRPRRQGERSTPALSASGEEGIDRKSTRLNSSHVSISYAVFCLKKKILMSTPWQ